MNYEFPHIRTLDDVLLAIQGIPEFRVTEKEDYTVVNYCVSFEHTWDITDGFAFIRRECRGLIFDKNGNLVSRPYHKFFNANERPETQLNKINLYEPHVILEKLDGSMIRPIPADMGFRLSTKAGVTDVAMNAEYFIADKPEYANFIMHCLNRNITPIFEWVSRKNRIVVDYPKDNLILTATRNNVTGEYTNYEQLKSTAAFWKIPLVKAIDGLSVQNIELLAKQVREWDDGEGIVIRFDDGHMVKIKADEYVLRHKSKSVLSLEKTVIEVIVEDAVDDIIPLLSKDDADALKKFQTYFWNCFNETCSALEYRYKQGAEQFPDPKDFAINFVQTHISPQCRTIMYSLKRGEDIKDVLVNLIKKSTGTQTKIDRVCWIWNSLKWEDFYQQVD